MNTQTWNDCLANMGQARCIGREYELLLLQQQLTLTSPRALIVFISGVDGVGKTTLLQHYQMAAQHAGFVAISVDDSIRSAPALMSHIASCLTKHGISLTQFEQLSQAYQRIARHIAQDAEAPHGLAAHLEQRLLQDSYRALETLPEVRRALASTSIARATVDRRTSTNWPDEWSGYLERTLRQSDETTLLRDPVGTLTPRFMRDLNDVVVNQPLLICIDDVDLLTNEIREWLVRLPDYHPSTNIRLALGSKGIMGPAWGVLQRITLHIRLEPFRQQVAEQLLDMYGVTQADRRRDILQSSDGLPLLLCWQAEQAHRTLDRWAPSRDIVEQFLQRVPDTRYQRVALFAAIPAGFNHDILAVLLGNEPDGLGAAAALEWLSSLSVVQRYRDGWRYHPLVRQMLHRYQSRLRSDAYYQGHGRLAQWYDSQRQQIAAQQSPAAVWADETWQEYTLAMIFHSLMASPRTHWGNVVGLLAQAIWERLSFAKEIVNLLDQEPIRDELHRSHLTTLSLIRQHLEAMTSDVSDQHGRGAMHHAVTDIFEELRDVITMPPRVRSYVCHARGVFSLASGYLEKALPDFDQALEADPDQSMVRFLRGICYLTLRRIPDALDDFQVLKEQDISTPPEIRLLAMMFYGEALLQHGAFAEACQQFDAVLRLEPTNSWTYARRGETWRQRDEWEQALADFNHALHIDPANAWALARRGDIQRQLGDYHAALADLDRAIALDASDAWAFASRGETYRRLERYTEAIKDFDSAIAINPNDPWTLASRGETYRLMGKYQAALRDFDRAIKLDPSDPWPIATRGEVYRAMGQLDSAVANFNWALELDDQDIWTMVSRGDVHASLGRYELALFDYDRVIALEPHSRDVFIRRAETYAALCRYDAALADLDRVMAFDMQEGAPRVEVFSRRSDMHLLLGQWPESIADLEQALALGGEDAHLLAQRALAHLGMKQYAAAIRDLNHAMQLDEILGAGGVLIAPTTTTALALRGEAYRCIGEYAAALEDFTKALAAHSQDAWALARRSATYCMLGQLDAASADIQQSLSIEPNDYWALAGRAEIARLLGDYHAALTDFERAAQIFDRDAWVIAHRGATARLIGNEQQALADFQQALLLDPDYAWAYGQRGETYRQLKRYEEARNDFRQALARDEANTWVLAQLSETERALGNLRAATDASDHALAFAPDDDWLWYARARLHLLANRHDAFEHDIHRAQTLADADSSERARLHSALYTLASGDVALAETRYADVVAVCESLPMLRDALKDVEDLLHLRALPGGTIQQLIQQRIVQLSRRSAARYA